MKTITSFCAGLLVAGLFAFSATTTVDPADKSLARVEKKSGKFVFLECEPVGEYDVAFEFKTTVGGVSQPSDFSQAVLKRAMKVAEKENKEFDAVVIKSGERMEIAIKFK